MTTMTLMQEAYTLMQQQPESNIKILVDLLKTMSPGVHIVQNRRTALTDASKRTGVARGTVVFPPDFDEHFDDLNDEIAAMFMGENE